MKATGIVRRIDDLGRVVIPKEIRKTLRIKEGTPLEIFTDREGQIILKKYSPIGELNTFAAEYAEALVQTTGLTACITDRDQVVAACGSGSRELEGKEISSDLDAVIAGRECRLVSRSSRENIPIIVELPAQRLHNVNLLRQKVQAQRPAKQRVTLEHRQAVSDAVLHAAFLRPL